MDDAPALVLTGLRKRFGDKVSERDVTPVVPPGSFYGVVGPTAAAFVVGGLVMLYFGT